MTEGFREVDARLAGLHGYVTAEGAVICPSCGTEMPAMEAVHRCPRPALGWATKEDVLQVQRTLDGLIRELKARGSL